MAGQRNSYGKRSHDYGENGGSKRRNAGNDKESFAIGDKDTVYRYVCPAQKIGTIIGRGGEIVKQLRADTRSKIRIGETVQGCDERVVTIYSSNEESNVVDGFDEKVCPAQDALFKVHEKIIYDENASDDDREDAAQVTVKLLVPSDQIGCIIGKGGQIVQNIRSDTGAQIRILKDHHLPACALSSDELVQISGDGQVVRKALYQIATCLHDNPSRSQHLLSSSVPNVYPPGSLVSDPRGAPVIGYTPLYPGYKAEGGDWSRSLYSSSRDEGSPMEFSLRLICPTANIGGVIGKGGSIINQIRQDSGASIKVDSSTTEDDCVISISTKEYFEDISPTVDAALRLQPRCSEKVERDSGLISYTTRLLVPTSRIGCLIGKGGSIITEMRRFTKANIRILSKENLPKVADEDEEMVLISGDLDNAEVALRQVTSRLRANLFDKEGTISSSYVPVVPYVPMSVDEPDSLRYESRDAKRHVRGRSYLAEYESPRNLPPPDEYGSYSRLHGGAGGSGYGVYSGYSSGRSSGSGLSGHNPVSRRKNYY